MVQVTLPQLSPRLSGIDIGASLRPTQGFCAARRLFVMGYARSRDIRRRLGCLDVEDRVEAGLLTFHWRNA